MLNCKLLSKQAAGIKHLYFSLGDGNHHWPAMAELIKNSVFWKGAAECNQITTSKPNHLRAATDHYEQPNASQQPNIPHTTYTNLM